MKLIKASMSDSDKLIEYYSQTSLPGRVTIQTHRKENFFSSYSIQSKDFVTYMLISEKDNSVQALASLIFRKAWIQGQEQTIGYATDLRVSNNRKAILEWSNHFLPLLEEEKSKRNCTYIFSVVVDRQSQAYNAFIRPRSTRRLMPRYYLYRKFDIVSLHGRKPFTSGPLDSITTRQATISDTENIADYIARKMQRKNLQFNNSSEHFLQNLETWEGLSIEDFILAIDNQNNIVGCTALWDPNRIAHYVVLNYDPKTTTLKEGLHFLSYFGLTKRLASIGENLQSYFLAYLLADNPDIFHALVSKAYDSVDKKSFIAYPHFEGDLISEPPNNFFSSAIHCGLYCVLSPETPPPSFLKPRIFSEAPDFELAFI